MTKFFWNGKSATSPLAKTGVTAGVFMAILSPLLIIAFFVVFISAMWNHDLTALIAIGAFFLFNRILNLRKKPLVFKKPSVSDLITFAGFALAFAGLWFHVVFLIVIGLLMTIRLSFSK
jgi:hypothetical protein